MHYNFISNTDEDIALIKIEDIVYRIKFFKDEECTMKIECRNHITNKKYEDFYISKNNEDFFIPKNNEDYLIKEIGILINKETNFKDFKLQVEGKMNEKILGNKPADYKLNILKSQLDKDLFKLLNDYQVRHYIFDLSKKAGVSPDEYKEIFKDPINCLDKISDQKKFKRMMFCSGMEYAIKIMEGESIENSFEQLLDGKEKERPIYYEAMKDLNLLDDFLKDNPLFNKFTKEDFLSVADDLYLIENEDGHISFIFNGEKILYEVDCIYPGPAEIDSGEKFFFQGEFFPATLDSLRLLEIILYSSGCKITGNLNDFDFEKPEPEVKKRNKLKL